MQPKFRQKLNKKDQNDIVITSTGIFLKSNIEDIHFQNVIAHFFDSFFDCFYL